MDNQEWVIFNFLQNSPVTLYWRMSYLEEACQRLRDLGYELDVFDCATWHTQDDMHEQVAKQLNFPAYYGMNEAAFKDCLLRNLQVPPEGGRVLVLFHFDIFLERIPWLARDILNTIAIVSRSFLMYRKHFFALAQSDNPDMQRDPIGCQYPRWNNREWLQKERGL